MRTVYAIQVQIALREGLTAEQCQTDLKDMIRQWVEGKYKRTWATDISLSPNDQQLSPVEGHSVRTTVRSAGDSELFTLQWSHPDDNDPTTTWVVTCVVARHVDVVQFALLLRISATRIVLRPVRFELGRPRIISDLLENYSVSADGWAICPTVERITPPQVEDYVKDVLLSTERTLPVIMLSPDVWTGSHAVDPDRLFQRLQGFAHVAVLEDKWAAFKLTDSVGKSLSCFNGAVRVYWPGFKVDDRPFQHRLFLPDSIRYYAREATPLDKYLFQTLSTIASYRYTEGAVIRNVRKALLDEENRHIEDLRQRIRKGGVEKEKLETELLETFEKIDTLTKERDALQEDLDAQKASWAEYQQAMAAGDEEPTSTTTEAPQLETVADAVRRAQSVFSGPLVFLDSAIESAEESPYQIPERVYECLEALHLVASEWKRKSGELGQSFGQALGDLGFEAHGVSQTSKGKWADEYKFVYKGKKRGFEEHVTLGAKQDDKCLSVHWYRDNEEMVIVIGHCGRHLTNTSS